MRKRVEAAFEQGGVAGDVGLYRLWGIWRTLLVVKQTGEVGGCISGSFGHILSVAVGGLCFIEQEYGGYLVVVVVGARPCRHRPGDNRLPRTGNVGGHAEEHVGGRVAASSRMRRLLR